MIFLWYANVKIWKIKLRMYKKIFDFILNLFFTRAVFGFFKNSSWSLEILCFEFCVEPTYLAAILKRNWDKAQFRYLTSFSKITFITNFWDIFFVSCIFIQNRVIPAFRDSKLNSGVKTQVVAASIDRKLL